MSAQGFAPVPGDATVGGWHGCGAVLDQPVETGGSSPPRPASSGGAANPLTGLPGSPNAQAKQGEGSGVTPNWRLDPRPDILADHAWWQTVLARTGDEEIGWLLHGARAAGTTIVLCEDGVPRLKPLIDPALGFSSAEAWREFRDRYLRPYSAEIAQALSVVARDGGKASA